MSIATRLKSWNDGDTLTASDLNTEFNIAINALGDGTKDANVAALTAQGTFTANAAAIFSNTVNVEGAFTANAAVVIAGTTALNSNVTVASGKKITVPSITLGTTAFDLQTALIPAGTKALFYQATAPTGWTRDTSADDKFIRVVSAGSPGTSGGSWDTLSHSHNLSASGWADVARIGSTIYFKQQSVTAYDANAWVTGSSNGSGTFNLSSGVGLGGATNSGTVTHGSSQHAYSDVLIATKDAY